MPTSLAHLPFLRDLYSSVLQPKHSRYPFDPALLDKISLFQGDITDIELDSIVNAANSSLLGGGGVDGAIHAAAGNQLLEECQALHGCATGDAKITRGYCLPSQYVIHTVGPVYSEENVAEKARQLASCYQKCLELAVANSLKSVAFPSISTGIYGYPIRDATHIALDSARRFFNTDAGKELDVVVFVVWSDKDKQVYEDLIPEYFPSPSQKNVSSTSHDS